MFLLCDSYNHGYTLCVQMHFMNNSLKTTDVAVNSLLFKY